MNNARTGKPGTMLNKKHTPEAIEKMKTNSTTQVGKNNPMYGTHKSQQQKDAHSENMKNRKGIKNKNTGEFRCIKQIELEYYLNTGWIIAYPAKNKIHIKNMKIEKSKMIYEHEIESFLKEGWERGRIPWVK